MIDPQSQPQQPPNQPQPYPQNQVDNLYSPNPQAADNQPQPPVYSPAMPETPTNPNQPQASPAQIPSLGEPELAPTDEKPPEDIFGDVEPADSGQQPVQEPAQPQPNTQPDTNANALFGTEPGADDQISSAAQPVQQPVSAEQYQAPRSGSPIIKILITVGIILLLAGGGFAGYWFFFSQGTLALEVNPSDAKILIDSNAASGKKEIKLAKGDHVVEADKDGYFKYSSKVNISPAKTTILKIDMIQVPQMSKLSDKKFDFITVTKDNKYLLGLAENTIYRISLSQNQSQSQSSTPSTSSGQASSTSSGQAQTTQPKIEAITGAIFKNVVGMIWNTERDTTIVKIRNDSVNLAGNPFYRADLPNGTITTWLFDFKITNLVEQKPKYLASDIGEIVWPPDSQKLYFFEKGYIVETSSDFTNLNRLSKTALTDPKISISPDGKYLTLVPIGKQYNANFIYIYDLYQKQETKLTQEGDILGAKFAPDSNKVLYSVFTKDIGTDVFSLLSVIGKDGQNQKSLKINSFIDKAIWLSNSKYFVYPKTQGEIGSDKLMQVNVESGEEIEYQYKSVQETVHFDQMVISGDDKMLYFISNGFAFSVGLETGRYDHNQ